MHGRKLIHWMFEITKAMAKRRPAHSTPMLLFGAGLFCFAALTSAQNPKPRTGLSEPVHREETAKVAVLTSGTASDRHPLMEALELAQSGIERIDKEIKDYTCKMTKRESIDGKLGEPETMEAKIRHVPFSVYLKFVAPQKVANREVLYVEGQNNGKLLAHEGSGFRARFGSVYLPPTGSFAMAGQRYPVTNAGMRNLLVRLVEVGERDLKDEEVQVKYYRQAKLGDRPCLCIEVVHPTRNTGAKAYMARIFVDQELQLPVRYEAFDWPKREGEKPEILEQYIYNDIQLNVGLTDRDFDRENPSYKFN